MKYIFIILFVLTFRNIYSQDIFEFKPFNPTIYSLVKTEDGSIIYGCNAGVIVKEKNSKIQMKKVFDYGDITNLEVKGKYILGQSYKKLISSSDNGDNWKEINTNSEVNMLISTNNYFIVNKRDTFEIYDLELNLQTKLLLKDSLPYFVRHYLHSSEGYSYTVVNDTVLIILQDIEGNNKIVYLNCSNLNTINEGFNEFIPKDKLFLKKIHFVNNVNDMNISSNNIVYKLRNDSLVKEIDLSNLSKIYKYKNGYIAIRTNFTGFIGTIQDSYVSYSIFRMDEKFRILDSVNSEIQGIIGFSSYYLPIIELNDTTIGLISTHHYIKLSKSNILEMYSLNIMGGTSRIGNSLLNEDIDTYPDTPSIIFNSNYNSYTSYDNFLFKSKTYKSTKDFKERNRDVIHITDYSQNKGSKRKIYKHEGGKNFNYESNNNFANSTLVNNNFYVSNDFGKSYAKINTDFLPDTCIEIEYLGSSLTDDYFSVVSYDDESKYPNKSYLNFVISIGSENKILKETIVKDKIPLYNLNGYVCGNGIWIYKNENSKFYFYSLDDNMFVDSIDIITTDTSLNYFGLSLDSESNNFLTLKNKTINDSTSLVQFYNSNFRNKTSILIDSIRLKREKYFLRELNTFKLKTNEIFVSNTNYIYEIGSQKLYTFDSEKLYKEKGRHQRFDIYKDMQGYLNYAYISQFQNYGHFFLSKKTNTSVDEKSNYSLDLNTLSFPNPAQNQLAIELNSSYSNNSKLLILDLTGNIVAEYPISTVIQNNKLRIDISDLSKGAYLYQILDNNLIHTQGKFIKE